jgi:hypothetical protein
MRVFRDDYASGTRGGPGPGIGAPGALVVPAALIAGVVAFALARVALLPGLGFWDTGEFQTVGPVMGTAHPTGFPAYVLLGWLVSALLTPFGEPAFRMNLLSALLVAGGVGLTVVLVTQLTGRVWLAFATGLLLAAIPVVWNIATHADAHALHFFLVALLLVVLVGWEQRIRAAGGMFAPGWGPAPGRRTRLARPGDRWLVAAAIVYGVGLATHTLMLLLAPGVGLFVLATAPGILRRVRFILGLAAAVLGTALLLYLELPIRAGLVRAPLVYGHPETLDGFLYVALGQQFVGALYQPFADLDQKVIDLVAFGRDQLGLLVLLVPLAFVVTAKRQPRYGLLTGVSFLLTTWFASSYVNADIARYYLGPAIIVVSWLGVLLAAFVEFLARLMGADDPMALTGVMSSAHREGRLGAATTAALILEVVVALAILVPTFQAVPERAVQADLSTQHDAKEWADAAMATLEPNSLVLSWWSYSTTLWYDQIVEGQRPDVWIVDDRTLLDENLGDVTDVIDANLGRRPVYAVRLPGSEDMQQIEDLYDVQVIEMPTEQSMLKILGRKQA